MKNYFKKIAHFTIALFSERFFTFFVDSMNVTMEISLTHTTHIDLDCQINNDFMVMFCYCLRLPPMMTVSVMY